MYRKKKSRFWFWFTLLLAVLFFGILGRGRAAKDLEEQTHKSIRQAVLQSAAQCYAAEGMYPARMDYLEEHYGLTVNHKKYYVIYEAFGSNLPPDVSVLDK